MGDRDGTTSGTTVPMCNLMGERDGTIVPICLMGVMDGTTVPMCNIMGGRDGTIVPICNLIGIMGGHDGTTVPMCNLMGVMGGRDGTTVRPDVQPCSVQSTEPRRRRNSLACVIIDITSTTYVYTAL